MNSITEAIELILGDKSIGYYLACFFFSSGAMFVMLIIGSQNRDKSSPRTPEKFSYGFLLLDNAKKAVATYILLFFGYRFAPEFQMAYAVGLGIAASMGLVFLMNALSEWIPGFKKFIQVKQEKP